MAKTASLNIRIDPETKKSAEELFSHLGITVTDAINMFLRQSLLNGGLPFDVKVPEYNKETLKAMVEAKKIAKSGKGYSNIEEMFKELDN